MRLLVQTLVLLAVFVAPREPFAHQQFAIPMGVSEIVKAPPSVGQLVRVSGYLETVGQDTVLRDDRTGQTIELDFTESTTPLTTLLNGQRKNPVEVTGRISEPSKNGKPVIGVIGAIKLTP